MEQLIERLNLLETKVKRMEEKLNQLPIPFRLMYRPPLREQHMNIVDYLNEVEARLKQLENGKGV